MSEVTRVKVTEVETPEVGPIGIYVDENGRWYAEVGDIELDESSLDVLKRNITIAVKSWRIEVPFVSTSGKKGVMRGLHASTGEILVTWEDGKKGRLHRYARVFAPGAIDEGDIGLIKLALDEIAAREAEVNRYRERSELARDLYMAEVGEDLLSKRRSR